MGVDLMGSPAPMPVTTDLPGYQWFDFLKNAAVRTGIYAGVFLSIILTAWVLIANGAPFLEKLAVERNIVAAAFLVLFFCVPLLRFYRSPAELLLSGLIAWALLTLTYRIQGLVSPLLEENFTAFHVFALGAVSYLVFATLSWIGTIIWRVRAAKSTHINR
jgi:hypothetical protein